MTPRDYHLPWPLRAWLKSHWEEPFTGLRRLFASMLPVVLLVTLELPANAQDCVRWVPRTDVGSPGQRWGHAMAYDSDRGVTVVFGGGLAKPLPFIGIISIDDTWEFDGDRWRQIVIEGSSPSARAGGTMCYDTVRKEMVLFGGYGTGFRNDTWTYRSSGAGRGVWTRKNSLTTRADDPGYSGRDGHAMVFDSQRGVAVIVGGTTAQPTGTGGPPSKRISEVWEWDGENWREITKLFPVRARFFYEGPTRHAMIYDSDTATISISGGGYYYYPNAVFDEWRDLDWPGLIAIHHAGSSFYAGPNSGQPIGGASVGERQHHAAAYDTHRHRIVIFGGTLGSSKSLTDPGPGDRHDEAQYFSNGDGTGGYGAERLNISTPSAREGHAMVYDIRRQRTVLFGGIQGNSVFGDTWEYGLGAVPILYVDGTNSGTEDGSLAHPHRTVRQGAAAVDDCPAVLTIQAGDYLEGSFTIKKSMRLEARNGQVQIH